LCAFLFRRFGGAGDGRFGLDFGGGRVRCFSEGGRPGFRPFFGGEVVEFVLSGHGNCVNGFGVRGRGLVCRQFGNP